MVKYLEYFRKVGKISNFGKKLKIEVRRFLVKFWNLGQILKFWQIIQNRSKWIFDEFLKFWQG